MIKVITVITLFYWAANANAQHVPFVNNIDSVIHIIKDEKVDDTIKVSALIELARWDAAHDNKEPLNRYFKTAEGYAKAFRDYGRLLVFYNTWSRLSYGYEYLDYIFEKIKLLAPHYSFLNDQGLAALMDFCLVLERNEKYIQELELLGIMEVELQKRKKSHVELARLDLIRTQLFQILGDESQAIKFAKSSLAHAQKSNNAFGIIRGKYMEAVVFEYFKHQDSAFSIIIPALVDTLVAKQGFTSSFAYLAFSSLMKTGKYAEAIPYGIESIEPQEVHSNIETNIEIATCEWKSGNETAAQKRFLSCQNLIRNQTLAEGVKDHYNTAKYDLAFGEFQFAQKKLKSAASHFKSAIEYLRQHSDDLRETTYWKALKLASQANILLGQFKSALAYEEELIIDMEKERNNKLKFSSVISAARIQENLRQKELNNLESDNKEQGIILLIIGIGLLITLALGFLAWRQSRLVAKEKQKSEELLLNMLPPAIMGRMKKGEHTIADYYESATVVFIDMVGFTKYSTTVDPKEMVQLLNGFFSKMDHLTTRFGLEKIKTIGDCYMAVSGVPTPYPDHLARALDFSLAVLSDLNGKLKSDVTHFFKIGIETGPLVAGIIGEKRFLFDLWGNTVNTASRLENNAAPGTIMVTSMIYDQMKDQYPFEQTNILNIKGIGNTEVYILKGDRS